MTIAEKARAAGVSVATILRRIKEKKEEQQIQRAQGQLINLGAGWNPRAGNKKRNKGY